MPLPPLKSVAVSGYTSIRDAQVELTALNALVGANGSGKSNFIGALELLGRIVDNRLNAFVGESGGASQLLHDRRNPITLQVESEKNRYEAILQPTRDDRLFFQQEATEYYSPHVEGWTRREFTDGTFETVLHREAEQKGAGPSVERYIIDLLQGCRVYHFHDTGPTAPVKQPGPSGDNLLLHADASNLAAVLRVLRDGAPAAYRRIVGTIRLAAPFFGDFVLEPEAGHDLVRLRWRHVDSDRSFSAHQLSDGTLRFIALATLLLDPDRLPALVVLDEPELGLHPYAIVQLADMLRAASVHSQVVVATQSVTLIDQLALADLIVVQRDAGASTFTRPDPEQLAQWLDDYSVGELWQKSLLGGRPAPERS